MGGGEGAWVFSGPIHFHILQFEMTIIWNFYLCKGSISVLILLLYYKIIKVSVCVTSELEVRGRQNTIV